MFGRFRLICDIKRTFSVLFLFLAVRVAHDHAFSVYASRLPESGRNYCHIDGSRRITATMLSTVSPLSAGAAVSHENSAAPVSSQSRRSRGAAVESRSSHIASCSVTASTSGGKDDGGRPHPPFGHASHLRTALHLLAAQLSSTVNLTRNVDDCRFCHCQCRKGAQAGLSGAECSNCACCRPIQPEPAN